MIRILSLLLLGLLFFSPSAHAQPFQGCYTAAPNSTPGTNSCLPAIQASQSTPISVASGATTQLIAGTAGQAIYVTSYDFMAGGTVNATLVYGTGSNCATGQGNLTGAYPLIAQAGISKGNGTGVVLYVPQGNALCITTSSSQLVAGSVSYVSF